MKQRRFVLRLALLVLMLAATRWVVGIDCFPKSKAKLPKASAGKNGNGDPDSSTENYRAIVGSVTSANPFVIYGGRNKYTGYVADGVDKACTVVRMDLDLNAIRWMRNFDVNEEAKEVEGLAINIDETKVAVYARKEHGGSWSNGKKIGLVFVIKASDGGQISR